MVQCMFIDGDWGGIGEWGGYVVARCILAVIEKCVLFTGSGSTFLKP